MGSTLKRPICKRCGDGSMLPTYHRESSCYVCGHVSYVDAVKRKPKVVEWWQLATTHHVVLSDKRPKEVPI